LARRLVGHQVLTVAHGDEFWHGIIEKQAQPGNDVRRCSTLAVHARCLDVRQVSCSGAIPLIKPAVPCRWPRPAADTFGH